MNKIVKHGGNLRISNDVITKIAEIAATEIYGVASEGQSLAQTEKNIASKLFSPVKVKLVGDAVEIDVNIVIKQDYKITAVAEAVQQSVKSAVQSMTGITVSRVCVNIVSVKLKVEAS